MFLDQDGVGEPIRVDDLSDNTGFQQLLDFFLCDFCPLRREVAKPLAYGPCLRVDLE